MKNVLDELFATIGPMLKALHTEARYVIDSFPVAVCHSTRISQIKYLTINTFYRHYASKHCCFYGAKVQVVATTDGLPVPFHIHPGSTADMTDLRLLHPDLPAGSMLYTDTACTDYACEGLAAILGPMPAAAPRRTGPHGSRRRGRGVR